MMTRLIIGISCCVALAVCLMGLLGCETTDTNNSITVMTPEGATAVTLSGVGASVSFTATATDPTRPLFLPLVWSASNEGIGNVTGRGVTGVYVSRGAIGANVITVRDQGGAEGIAVVTQTAAGDGG